MNRLVLAAVFCALVSGAVPAGAQNTPAPANGSTNTYNDPAMSFTAPAGFKYAGGHPYDSSSNDPTIVATFVKDPGKPEMHVIQIQIEYFEGVLSGYSTLADNELRGQLDGVFVGQKKQTALSNGMPALWEEISVGEGFQEMKRWEYLWVDGQRGIILSDTGRYGVISEEQAKAELANASAVAYPRNRM